LKQWLPTLPLWLGTSNYKGYVSSVPPWVLGAPWELRCADSKALMSPRAVCLAADAIPCVHQIDPKSRCHSYTKGGDRQNVIDTVP